MRRVLLALGVLALLVFAPPAVAGGWATVGLSSTPAGTDPGTPWNVTLTVLQHGRTPLDGLAPTITIRNGDALETFAAKPAGKPGTYRASVVFPSAGTWTYEVNDGFITGQPHTFPPVEIGGAPAAAGGAAAGPQAGVDGAGAQAGDDGGSLLWLAIPGVALLLAAGFLLARDRQRRHHQPQAA